MRYYMEFDVTVVGAGASGLTAAIFAARAGARTAILEHKDKIGKKILATGNGKCNYTNLIQKSSFYRGDHNEFAMEVLEDFNVDSTLDFFKELGIWPKNRGGYIYPNSEQAASVVQVLQMECERLHIKIMCNEHVSEINKMKNGKYEIKSNNNHLISKKVILATGGCASMIHGSDGSGYSLAKSFGHRIIKPIPALTQLLTEGKFLKTISGVRMEAVVKLYADNQFITEEEGEVLFANYGISGIPVFQISRFAGRALEAKKKVTLLLDFFKEISENDMKQFIANRFSLNTHKSTEEVLVGLLNHKLAYILVKEAGINPEISSKILKKEEINKIAKLLKEFPLTVTACNTFENAQVTAGGVDVTEINGKTMESKLSKDLYLTGELLDIDGTCGGYNLQWAWSTGAIAGRNAGNAC